MTKKIVIEAMAAGFKPCGLKEYMIRLGSGIGQRAARLRKEHSIEITFLVPKGMAGIFGDDANYIERSKSVRWLYMLFPLIRCNLFHTPHQHCRFKYIKGAERSLMTVHDVNFIHTKTAAKIKRYSRRLIKRLRHATHLAFITKFAEEDTRKVFNFNHPCRVIYNGVTDLSPEVPARRPDLPESIQSGKYLFHLSTLVPHKNVDKLIEMMRFLPGRTLVIAGNWNGKPRLRELADQQPNVIALDSVSEEEKAWLYANCGAFLFPSKAEGFGLPPIEAMKFGKPTFLSTITSLPEVGGEVAYYWNDLLPEKMAQVVEEKLSLPADRDAIAAHAARFDWDKCVEEYIDYYLSILSEDKPS